VEPNGAIPGGQAGRVRGWRRDCAEPWLLASSLDDPMEILRRQRLRRGIDAFHGRRCRLDKGRLS